MKRGIRHFFTFLGLIDRNDDIDFLLVKSMVWAMRFNSPIDSPTLLVATGIVGTAMPTGMIIPWMFTSRYRRLQGGGRGDEYFNSRTLTLIAHSLSDFYPGRRARSTSCTVKYTSGDRRDGGIDPNADDIARRSLSTRPSVDEDLVGISIVHC
jgi:hypothetical protein